MRVRSSIYSERSHQTTVMLKCSRCPVKFKTRDTLAMHMLEHSYTVDEENPAISNDIRFNMFRSVAMSHNTGTRHLRTGAEYTCEICLKVSQYCTNTRSLS